jgi:hypothetical protein
MRPNMNGLGPAHVPFGGDTERALGLPCQPASCQGAVISLPPPSPSQIRGGGVEV